MKNGNKSTVIKSINLRKEVAEILEKKAVTDNRSVSNFVETILMREFDLKLTIPDK